jgi:hypothetical protein
MLLNGDIELGDRVTVGVRQSRPHVDVEQGGGREEMSDWS